VLSTNATEDLTPPSEVLTLELDEPPERRKTKSVGRITILDYRIDGKRKIINN
jgi:hypothetical protein